MQAKRKLGNLALVAVAFVWGNGFVASAVAVRYFSSLQVLAIRFTIAFFGLLLLNGRKLPQIKSKTWLHGSLLGVVLFLAFLSQTVGLLTTTASRNAFLTAVNVVIVPFLAWFFLKQPLSLKTGVGTLITFAGITTLSFDGVGNGWTIGDSLTLVCAVFFAGHIFLTSMIASADAAWALTLVQMGSAAICSWLCLLVRPTDWPQPPVTAWLAVLYLGLVSTLLAYFLQTWAQQYTTSTEAAVILSTESFFGMLGSIVLLGEPLTLKLLGGGSLILLGILVVESRTVSEKKSSTK